jgi:hypothetical protein
MLQLRDNAALPDRNRSDKMIVRLTNAERGTILAALRRWQSYPAAREADSIATNGGKHKPLDNGEIERVCKRLTSIEGSAMQLPCFVNQTMAPACGKRLRLRSENAAMTVIEIRPQHWGWKVFEAPGC